MTGTDRPGKAEATQVRFSLRQTVWSGRARCSRKVSPANGLGVTSQPKHLSDMKSNMGISDRAIRLFIGLTVLGLGIALNSPWGMLGVIPMITAGLGFCPLYCPLKINTTENPNGH